MKTFKSMSKNLFLSGLLLSFMYAQAVTSEFEYTSFQKALDQAIQDRTSQYYSDLKEQPKLEKEIQRLDKQIDTKFQSNQQMSQSTDPFLAKTYQTHLRSINDMITTRQENRELLDFMLKRIADFKKLQQIKDNHRKQSPTEKERTKQYFNLDY